MVRDGTGAGDGTGAAPTQLSSLTPGSRWNFTMQPHMLERGLSYKGSGEALRRFVAKLESGQRVVVSAMGGSVTRGHGGGPDSMNAAKGFPGSWSRHVFDFIQVWERRDSRAAQCAYSPLCRRAGQRRSMSITTEPSPPQGRPTL